MFALAAVVTFALWFLLDYIGQSVDPFNLLALGLCFVALHLLTGLPLRKGKA